MKKGISIILALLMLMGGAALAGNRRLKIVTTIFPICDWVREIAGESADITLLLDKGVDLHSFQPTAQDIMKISTADVFICVGGESEKWVWDALSESVNADMKVISLLDALGDAVKEEEITEGMEAEEGGDEEEAEYDEHVWLSLRNARALVKVIADALCLADADNADMYTANAAAYTDKLTALDAEYAEAVSGAEYKTLLFGDRFPFRYMADDYGLKCYAAFAGCSAESEASFETIIFLANKLKELNLPAVMTIEGSQHRIAETIISAASGKNIKLLTLNSLQGKPENGATYLSVMQDNLNVLREALNR